MHGCSNQKYWPRIVQDLVLCAGYRSHTIIFPFFAPLYYFGKDLPPIFLVGTEFMGKTHFVWNGLFSQNCARAKNEKRKKLYVGSKPHQHARYYADASCQQKPLCFCGKKGIGRHSHFWFFLQKGMYNGRSQ